MRCEHCGCSDIHTIGFESVGGGYRYCRACERGWWSSEGKQIETATVLGQASSIAPARRR